MGLLRTIRSIMFMRTYSPFGRRCCAIALAGALLAMSTTGTDAVDFGLIDAYQKKNLRALQHYATEYRNTPIEPYLFAARINARDAAKGPLSTPVAQGLERFAGVPPVEKLRAGLLKEWARSADWKQFEAHASRIPAWLSESDTELKCAVLLHAAARQKPSAYPRAELFSQMREFPPLCSDALAGAFSAGQIPDDLAYAKLTQLAAFGSRSGSLRLLHLISGEWGSEKTRVASSIVEILHAARDDFDDGRKELAARAGVLTPEALRLATVHVGILGAKKLEPGGHALIRSVDGYRMNLTGAAAEWRTRAAILAASWSDVLASVESLTPELRSEPFWGYWYARALQKLGRAAEARLLFSELARQPGYYGILSAEHVGIKPPYLTETPLPDHALTQQYLSRPEVVRAKALHRAGLWVEAALEWKHLMQGADSRAYYAAALAAKEQGLIDRQIGLAIRATSHFDLELRYPLVHSAEVRAASDAARIAPELTWAIIRQESRFISHAVSSAGAVGLMQLMPATAKVVAARSGMKTKPTRQTLVTPSANIELGTAFLGSLLRMYGGNTAYAAAAYNAGPGRVKKWRARLGTTEIERFVELIPFDETRDYTKQVLANYVMYAYARGAQPVRLMDLLSKKG